MCIGQKLSTLKRLDEFYILYFILLLLLCVPAFPQTSRTAESAEKSANSEGGRIPWEIPFRLCRLDERKNLEDQPIASDNESLFVPLTDGKLISVDPESGRQNWESDLGGRIVAAPHLSAADIIIVSETISENGSTYVVRRLNKADGLVSWRANIDLSENRQEIAKTVEEDKKAKEITKNSLSKAKIYINRFENKIVISNSLGRIFLLDYSEGKILQSKELRKMLSGKPFQHGNQIIFGTSEREIIYVSMENLDELSNISLQAISRTIYKVGKNLIWGDNTGYLYSSEVRKNKFRNNWRLRTGGAILSIAGSGQNLILTSLDNYLYMISGDAGEIIWKKRLANRPVFDLLSSNGYIVILTVGDPEALIIDERSGGTINKVIIRNNNFFTGSPGRISPYVFFPTAEGIAFYSSSKFCR